jgi:DNA-binding CsgD family transcriptional regulator
MARDLVALLHRLGLVALVRDPETAEVFASAPEAEAALRSASPGAVTIATARIGGHALRAEVLRSGGRGQSDLTPRQNSVGTLLTQGLRNREIAEQLRISTHTVRRHIEEILRRLCVPNRAAAAAELRRIRGIGHN